MKTFIKQASLAHFLLSLDSSSAPELFKGQFQKSRNPAMIRKLIRQAQNTQLAAISFCLLLHQALGSSIWSCLGTYFTFLKFPQNIQNMEINKQSHAIFWLIIVTIVRSHRYQPVKTRMLLINNLTPKFMVTRNYFLAELS